MPSTPGIKRLERNRYFVQVSRMDPRTGKRKFKRRWVKGSHAKAVEARKQALIDLEAEIAGVAAEEPMTLAGYVEQWLEARSSKLEPSTKAKYLNDLEKHILPKLGHMMISEIRPGTSRRCSARITGRRTRRRIG